MRMTGRRVWCRPICIMPARTAGDRDDGAQPGVSGPVSGRICWRSLGLPADAFAIDGVEYYGDIGYLKAGLQFADRITTVSPTYAAEIRTPSGGMGMDGLLRARANVLSGILNGIDETVWDPAHDPYLAARFDVDRLARRAANKAALQARFGLRRDPSKLLFGAITRLSAQKGIDLLLAALPVLIGCRRAACRAGLGRCAFETRLRAAAGHRTWARRSATTRAWRT